VIAIQFDILNVYKFLYPHPVVMPLMYSNNSNDYQCWCNHLHH